MEKKVDLFSNHTLIAMIVPLFFEQLLVMLVGMADTLIVSYVGEAAVSGVSLVNQFNIIFIFIFTALAAGGAVIISQYIGKGEAELAGMAASQLLLLSCFISIIISSLILSQNTKIMNLMFGKVDMDVMESCVIYLKISTYSYPLLAIYNSGTALYRSLGKTNITMYISILSNIINIAGNIIGVFVLKAGVAGVAYPSLISRGFSAVIITALCFKHSNKVFYSLKEIFCFNKQLLKHILYIAVPNGIENGICQLVKVALSSIVALFGTQQIAANGVAQSIWSMAALAGVAMGPAFITVIGQSVGSGNINAADYYFKKLSKITLAISSVWNFIIFLLTPFILTLYSLDQKTVKLTIWLVFIHNLFNAIAFPFSGAFSNGLRAAGDVKFTMYISIISTVAVRLFLSYFLGITLNMGVIGIAIAMVCDWIVRAIIFIFRQKSGSWKTCKVI